MGSRGNPRTGWIAQDYNMHVLYERIFTRAAIGLKKIVAYQITLWDFRNFFFPFGVLKMTVLDAGDFFWDVLEMFSLDITNNAHAVARGNHKTIRY